jgi:hypothetical protein
MHVYDQKPTGYLSSEYVVMLYAGSQEEIEEGAD